MPPPPLDLGAEALQEGEEEVVLEIVEGADQVLKNRQVRREAGVAAAKRVQVQRGQQIIQLQSQPSQLEAGAVVAEAVEGRQMVEEVVQEDGAVVEEVVEVVEEEVEVVE